VTKKDRPYSIERFAAVKNRWNKQAQVAFLRKKTRASKGGLLEKKMDELLKSGKAKE
jgi:hypothetical protein